MILHENIPLYEDAISFTAQNMDLKPEYVEKDYWITYALFSIFQNEIGKDTVFKGGTALSKCFQMIERFSEDIDLVVFRHEGETDNKLKAKLKQVGKALESGFSEVQIAGITHKMGMNRKALVFIELEDVWEELKPIYQKDFRELVYGIFPKEIDVYNTLKMIRSRMEFVQWSVKTDSN